MRTLASLSAWWGVEVSRRTNDSLTALGHPGGIVPSVGAKVVFEPTNRIRSVNAGPVGGASTGCRL